MEKPRFCGIFLRFRFLKVLVYKVDGTQILRPIKNILYTILCVTSFLLSEWRNVKTQKSRLKCGIKSDLYYKLHNK